MKLITKKCPNCGASLSFEETDKKVKCEYCKQDIMIEREKPHTNSLNLDEEFQLKIMLQKGTHSIQNKILTLAVIFLILIAIIVVFDLFFFSKIFDFARSFNTPFSLSNKPITSNSNSNSISNENNPPTNIFKNTYVTDLSQINGNSLNSLKQDSLAILNKWTVDVSQGTKSTEWEYVGLYLLKHKKLNSNELYVVYKKKYTVGKKVIDAYGAVSYSDLKLDSDNNVTHFLDGYSLAPVNLVDNDIRLQIHGYSSNQDFYNKVIQPKTNYYEVKATNGMYKELQK